MTFVSPVTTGAVELIMDGEDPHEIARTVGPMMALVVAEELESVADRLRATIDAMTVVSASEDAPRSPEEAPIQMSLREAAAVLGLSPATLRQQAHKGSLAATKRGRDWWVSAGEVERYAKENRGNRGRR